MPTRSGRCALPCFLIFGPLLFTQSRCTYTPCARAVALVKTASMPLCCLPATVIDTWGLPRFLCCVDADAYGTANCRIVCCSFWGMPGRLRDISARELTLRKFHGNRSLILIFWHRNRMMARLVFEMPNTCWTELLADWLRQENVRMFAYWLLLCVCVSGFLVLTALVNMWSGGHGIRERQVVFTGLTTRLPCVFFITRNTDTAALSFHLE